VPVILVILTKEVEFSEHLKKYSKIKYLKICPWGDELFHADGKMAREI
jgi:hypothetical protein